MILNLDRRQTYTKNQNPATSKHGQADDGCTLASNITVMPRFTSCLEGFRERPNLLNGMRNLSIRDKYLRTEEAGEEQVSSGGN
jgi:hypothetical protein